MRFNELEFPSKETRQGHFRGLWLQIERSFYLWQLHAFERAIALPAEVDESCSGLRCSRRNGMRRVSLIR